MALEIVSDRLAEPAGTASGRTEGRAWNSASATGIGSLPGNSADEAASMIAGELPDLPHIPELPARGVGADMIGRSFAILLDIFGEVVPSGWRISRRAGRDTQRAKDFMAWDLDAIERRFLGAQWLKLQICGPWTWAASVELPSGNRALTDRGAVADLAESLIDGLGEHLAEVRRRLPGTQLVVQVDEPGLPAVLAGSLPTASGFGTVRPVEAADAGTVLRDLVSSFQDVPVIAHCCHREIPVNLLRAAGFAGIAVDVTLLGTAAVRLDPVGEALEAGTVLVAGLVPTADPGATPVSLKSVAAPLLSLYDKLGIPRANLAQVVPTPTCGLSGASQKYAIKAMKTSAELAVAFQDLPEGW